MHNIICMLNITFKVYNNKSLDAIFSKIEGYRLSVINKESITDFNTDVVEQYFT